MNMASPKAEGDRERKTSESPEQEFDPQFKPIVSLPEVEVSTNEEEEDVMLKLRAKLFRFDNKTDDTSEWKERGTGELKLLKHRDNKTVRVVMRRDKTLKVCANHFITPYMELKPSAGSERAFVYTVMVDFADEMPKTECLAVRFGTVEFANQFKEKFNEAKEFVRTQCPLYSDELDSEEDSLNESGTDREDKENKDENAISETSRKPTKENDVSKELTKKLSDLNVANENGEK